ncbi:Gm20449 [Phodopus roborovskii]|uniref:Gm20449 protein n=1 Tax=Phodopus roborovskii TaxID=109678 RepID=A0AAU9Z0P0_PHORO|nr:Gm20449 [Phodopus roborovskii]
MCSMRFTCEWNPSGCCFDSILKGRKRNHVGSYIVIIIKVKD